MTAGGEEAGRGLIAYVLAPVLITAAIAGLAADVLCPGSVPNKPTNGLVVFGAAVGVSAALYALNAPLAVYLALGSTAVAAASVWAYTKRRTAPG